MDDSNILYYLALGAIYLISYLLKKKKKKNQDTIPNESPEPVFQTTGKKPSSFEDLFKELTGDDFSNKNNQRGAVLEERTIQPEIIPTRTNHEATLVDVVPPKAIERDKPVFVRDEKFKVKQEEVVEDSLEVHSLFQDEDSVRKAIILKEILDRKY